MSSKMIGLSLGIATLLAIVCLIAFASPASLQADSDSVTKAQTVQPCRPGEGTRQLQVPRRRSSSWLQEAI